VARTQTQIEKSLGARINQQNQNIDTVKGPVPDVFIIPEAAEIRSLEQRQDSIGYRYSFEYIKTQDRDTQVLFGANHGLRPSRGTPAVARGVSYTYTRPTEDRVIPAGRVVTTDDESVAFRVAYDVIMYANRADSYYNAVTRRYEVATTLVSLGTGVAFEIPPYSIRKLRDKIPGIDGIENTSRATDAKPEEDMVAFGRRTQAKFNGLETASADGLRQTLLNYAPTLIEDVIPVFSSDTQWFQRRTRRAAWDLYVRGQRIEDTESSFVADGVTSSFVLPHVPALAVTGVLINGLTTTFTFEPDLRPEVIGSTLAEDRVNLSFVPASGSTVTVQYQWNSLIYQLSNYITNSAKNPFKTDILVRAAQQVLLRIRLGVQPSTTFDTTTVLDNVRASGYEFFADPTRREIVHPETFKQHILNTTAGVRNIMVREFARATVGSMVVEPVELAPYEYADTTDALFVTERV
jgi:hypothetical protein